MTRGRLTDKLTSSFLEIPGLGLLQTDERDGAGLRAETTIRPSPDVLFRDLGDESILLDLKSGMYFGLNAVGGRIWQLIALHGRLGTIRDKLIEEYDAQPDQVWNDLAALITELTCRGLVALESPT